MFTRPSAWVRGGLTSILSLTVLAVCWGDRAASDQDDGAVALAKERNRSANNLKQIVLALHNYHDNFGMFPPAAYVDRSHPKNQALPRLDLDAEQLAKAKGEVQVDGKSVKLPLLSWRVAILPYIEEQALYQQFHLDEPWDSAHNKTLLAKMPKLYAPVRGKTKEPGMTYYQVFTGK